MAPLIVHFADRADDKTLSPMQRARAEQAFYDRYGDERPLAHWSIRIGAALLVAEFVAGIALNALHFH